jgi:hypothetical protein
MKDERLTKSAGEGRENRAMLDRAVTQNREVTEDERVEMFRQQFFQSSLPDLPKLSGWHMCWLTTTNPRDSIHMRIRLGYEPVKSEDVPGWEYATLKTGDWAGLIGVNEMLAFKLPISLYEKYMREAHHDAPLREEEKLTDTADFLEQQARSSKSRITQGDGNLEIGQQREAHFDLS